MRLTRFAAGISSIAFLGIATLLAIPPASGAPPQSGPPPQEAPQQQIPQSQQPLKVQVAVVNVFATVRDKHNGIITDLTQNDFQVYEDGVEQKVAFFSKEVNLPLTLGLLIDTSGSMEGILGAEQDTASRFVKEVMRPKDEAMVMNFDLDVNLDADFTQDTAVLERAIRRQQINAAGPIVTPGTIPQQAGGTNLYDAIYLACHDQLATEAGRKAVIVLTDAEDTGSKLSLKDAIEAAQRADAVIHVILLSDPHFYGSMNLGYSGANVARRMADDTGGRVIDVHNEKTLEKAFDVISEELRSQYVLGYYPTNTKRDGTFRKIKVEISRSDVKILARKGYYAPTR